MLLLMGGFGYRRQGYIAWGAAGDRPRFRRDWPDDDDMLFGWWLML